MRETPEHYELTWILSANLTDEEQKPLNAAILAVLQENKAENVGQILSLGKRKLAYPIGQHRHGSYYVLEFNLLPVQLNVVNRALKLDQNIVRFLIVVKSELTEEDIAKQEASRQKRSKAKEHEVEVPVKKEVASKKEASKISLADLDKKLDELLSDDNLNI